MSMEPSLFSLLAGVCPRAFPDVAPTSTAKPYVTWQAIGGETLRFIDNSAADKRNTKVQINVFAATRLESITLIRAIEDAMCASVAFVARPESEPMHDYDHEMLVYQAMQDFSIFAAR